ncbi:MAG: hypothetical protein AAGC56_09130 [Pseudomonadota bacterium]
MTDRLRQIWSGFEGVTTRRLTGGGVDNIERPLRRETVRLNGAAPGPVLPEGVSPPAAAAFEALKTRLAAAEARGKGGPRRRAPAGGERLGEGGEGSDGDVARLSAEGAPPEAKAMLRGMRATEDRTLRTGGDYLTRMQASADRDLKAARRKKRFGLF